MMKHYIFIAITLLISLKGFTQENLEEKRKVRSPVWIVHDKNIDIIGLSLAAFPKGFLKNDTTLTRTYGIRFEASLLAVLSPLMGSSPVSTNIDVFNATQSVSPTEIINGINLSSGTFGETRVNGFSGGLIIQYLYNMDGISVAGMSNLIEKHNGIALAFLGNESFKSNGIMIAGLGNETHYLKGIQIGCVNEISENGYGLQIGLWNSAKKFRGIQLGLWNKNDKRSLPIINWQFKS